MAEPDMAAALPHDAVAELLERPRRSSEHLDGLNGRDTRSFWDPISWPARLRRAPGGEKPPLYSRTGLDGSPPSGDVRDDTAVDEHVISVLSNRSDDRARRNWFRISVERPVSHGATAVAAAAGRPVRSEPRVQNIRQRAPRGSTLRPQHDRRIREVWGRQRTLGRTRSMLPWPRSVQEALASMPCPGAMLRSCWHEVLRPVCSASGSVCPSCSAADRSGHDCAGSAQRRCRSQGRPSLRSLRRSRTFLHLAEKILTSKSALEGERSSSRCLSPTSRARWSCSPNVIRRRLGTSVPILGHMMEAVHRYEGTVNQVMGDGVSRASEPHWLTVHAVRACDAALRMQQSVKRHAEEARRAQGGRFVFASA